MKRRANRIRPLFLAAAAAAGLTAGFAGAHFLRSLETRERLAGYSSELELVSERISGELSLFFDRLYNATDILLFSVRRHDNERDAAAVLGSPYIQTRLRMVHPRISAALVDSSGGIRIPVMGEICREFASPGFVHFDNVVLRSMGDSSCMAACADGRKSFIFIRRADAVFRPGRTALVVNVPESFFTDMIRRNTGYRFGLRILLVDPEGVTAVDQVLEGTSGREPGTVPAALTAAVADGGGTRQIGAFGYVGSSRLVSGYPITLLVLAERRAVAEVARGETKASHFLLLLPGALTFLLAALTYEMYRLSHYRTGLNADLRRESAFKAVLVDLREIYDASADEDTFLKQALDRFASAIPGFSYTLQARERTDQGGPPDPAPETRHEGVGAESVPRVAGAGPAGPRHCLTARLEDHADFRGMFFFGVDDAQMTLPMAEQARDFIVKQFAIKASHRRIACSLAEKEEMLDELRRWHRIMLGREDRIVELKREVNETLRNAGRPPRYDDEALQ